MMSMPFKRSADLDESARGFLEALDANGGALLESLSPGEARSFFSAGRDQLAKPVEQVAEIRDFSIPLHGRTLQARLYRPTAAQAGAGSYLFSRRRLGTGRSREPGPSLS